MINNKICTSCNIEKSISQYQKHAETVDGFRGQCNPCINKIRKIRRKFYPKSYTVSVIEQKCYSCKLMKSSDLFDKNKQKMTGLYPNCKECRSIKNQKIYQIKKEEIKIKRLKFYYANKKKVKEQNLKYQKHKEKTDILYKLKRRLRNRLYYALKKTSWKKNTHFSDYIGCSKEYLVKHLESQFKSDMTWDNHGKIWDIDHYMPLSSAKTEEELYKLCHYTNLRPEYCYINRNIKRDKIPAIS